MIIWLNLRYLQCYNLRFKWNMNSHIILFSNIHAWYIAIPFPYTHRLVIRIWFFPTHVFLEGRAMVIRSCRSLFLSSHSKTVIQYTWRAPNVDFRGISFLRWRKHFLFFITASVRNLMTVPPLWCSLSVAKHLKYCEISWDLVHHVRWRC